jgi:hypothetical protein
MQVYCRPIIIEEYIALTVDNEFVVLNIEWNEEKGWGWVEGEDRLPKKLNKRLSAKPRQKKQPDINKKWKSWLIRKTSFGRRFFV